MSEAPIEEIDRAIGELQDMRKALQEHGERVQRELSDYASTSRSALNSLKSLSDSLAQWKQPAA
jgi:DNA repair exonuclease SbcCD ATPase subunit